MQLVNKVEYLSNKIWPNRRYLFRSRVGVWGKRNKMKDSNIIVEYIKLNDKELLIVTRRPGEEAVQTIAKVSPGRPPEKLVLSERL